jgi:hypothetical protein
MNKQQYRKYLVKSRRTTNTSSKFGYYWPTSDKDVPWQYIMTKTYDHSNMEMIYNGPELIRKKQAFWMNKNTYVTGYSLKNNSSIIRPIWCKSREEKMINTLNELKNIHSKKITIIRRNQLNKTLIIKHLPVEIINYIISLTY